MAVLVLNQEEVEQLLDMEGCIEATADALASLARGEVHVPLRFVIEPEDEPSLIGWVRIPSSALASLVDGLLLLLRVSRFRRPGPR